MRNLKMQMRIRLKIMAAKLGAASVSGALAAAVVATFATLPVADAAIPVETLKLKMDLILSPLESASAYRDFLKNNSEKFVKVDEKMQVPPVLVEDREVKHDGETFHIGMGFRSVYIEAPVKTVVEIANNPKYFQSLYGLDKPAEMGAPADDGSFQARIFKLVPGIETQDYTLRYTSHWEDGMWIQRARLVKDEKNFALRDNIKFAEPSGEGTVFRELSLFYPMRWWVKLFSGTVRSVTAKELMKLNVALKCAAEKVHKGEPMSDSVAKSCHKAAN
jgi:hypothetical protein